ncbi:MAG: hypothetical protein WDW36_005214 [Sanguina aurantia]
MASAWAQRTAVPALPSSRHPAPPAPPTDPATRDTAHPSSQSQAHPAGQDTHSSAVAVQISPDSRHTGAPGTSSSSSSSTAAPGHQDSRTCSTTSSSSIVTSGVSPEAGAGSGAGSALVQGRRVMKPPGRRAAAVAAAAAAHGPPTPTGIVKPAVQDAAARPAAVFKQVHGTPHQKRHAHGHAPSHSAPSDGHTGPPTSHAEDPFHQLFRVFDVEQSAASCAAAGASGARSPVGVPTPARSGAGSQPGSVPLDEAYVRSHFLPMVSGERVLSGCIEA